ncbi:MAG: hypothetical protein R3F07_19055 [Opitutaceae bacterium]
MDQTRFARTVAASQAQAEDRADVLADRLKGGSPVEKFDVADRAEHDDAEDHRERLQPEHVGPGEDAEIEASGEGSAPERDGTLQPAGSRQAKVGRDGGTPAAGMCVGDGGEILFDF